MRDSIRRLVVFVAGVWLCAAGSSQLPAQQSGAISGTVLDQTGKPIPNAVLQIKNESTGALRSVVPESGVKTVAGMYLGPY
jgi:hypothetical protein